MLLTVTTLLLGLVGLAPAQAIAQVTGSVQISGEDQLTDTTWDSTVTTTPADAARAYQWLRDGQPIAGENDDSYDTTSADVGHFLSLRVIASATGYAPAELTSAAYGPIQEDDESDDDDLWTFDAYKPVIVGKPRVGQTVKVTTDEDDYSEDTTLVYQWLLGGQPAKKGTATTFKIKKKYRGKVLSVRVTASEVDYETETVTSKPVKIRR